jgi:hypothetical protein
MHKFYLLILIFLTNNIFANVALKDIVLSDSLMHQIVSISSNNTDENEITKQLSQIYAKEWKAISNENRTAILSLLHIQHDSIFSSNDSSYKQCIILADSFLLSKEFEFAKFPDTYKSKGGSFAYNYKIYLARIIFNAFYTKNALHFLTDDKYFQSFTPYFTNDVLNKSINKDKFINEFFFLINNSNSKLFK